jgi:DNA ligase 1
MENEKSMTTEYLLKSIEGLISDLREDDSRNYKESRLSHISVLERDLLSTIYNPFILFNVTSKTLRSRPFGLMLEEYKEQNIFTLLRRLSTGDIPRGDAANYACGYFIDLYPDHEETILRILDKDLACGISIKTLNKCWPGTAPEFNVPLAKDYDEGLCDFEKDVWYASRKMDGVRCLAFVDVEGKATLYSRNGLKFETLNKIKEDIEQSWFGSKPCILDGEICLIDIAGNEHFSDVMREIRRKNHTIERPLFYVFDLYTPEEFKKGNSSVPFSVIIDILQDYTQVMDRVCYLPQKEVKSEEDFLTLSATLPEEWEGFMLRKEMPTVFKRSKNLLKVKKFKDAEFTVDSVTSGHKMIDGVEKRCVAALNITHKGYPVKVGSGLSDKQRTRWYYNKDLIVGKKITVKYFNESIDKDGNLSLRFPTLKTVWEDEKI